MKVFFDQNVPHKLRTALGRLTTKHEIVTAAYMGWSKLENGELLRTVEENGMDLFVTDDGTLRYEQNLTGRQLAIVALSTDNWPILKEHVPEVLARLITRYQDRFRPWSAAGLAGSSKKHRCNKSRRLQATTQARTVALMSNP